jgi:Carboxypeptidase regulatory-like domain
MNRPVSGFKVLAFAFALLGLLALLTGVGFGQAISGDLVGTVLDSSGAAVANVDIQIVNVGTGVTSATKTNGTGEYHFGNLEAGNYKLTVKASGFRTVVEQADVQLNKTGTVNFTLAPGSAGETVEVSGAPPIIDTTTAQIETNYTEQQLQDLPSASVGLGVLNLSLLQAGVGSTGGLGAGTGPSVGGQRPRDNNFTIDGVDNNDKTVTGPLVYVPNDAVANFSILQNQFSPEFGHSNGGQFNTIIDSGTNSFHGRAYEYFQNRNLNAVDQALANEQIFSNARYDNNRFGGELGGPIFKNKLFFFANYEYNPIGQAAIPSSALYAPTAAGYSTLLASPGVSTANVNALKAYAIAPSSCSTPVVLQGCPGPLSINGTSVDVGILPVVAPNYSNTEALVTSMDYNLSDKDQIRGRYIYNKLTTLDIGAALPEFFTPLIIPYHLVDLAEYHTFTPALSNEFRVGFHRTTQDYTVGNQTFLPTLDAFPNIVIGDLGGINVGPDPNAPQYAVQNLYQAVDNVTWIKGNHTLKFGFEARKYIAPQLFIQRSRGDYEYNNLSTFADDELPDIIAERSFGSAGYSGNQYALYSYVNDIWKIRPNFSINIGLRHEYTQVPYGWTQQSLNAVADDPALGLNFTAPQASKKDFMPRVGFAYSPGTSGNTSIRGGFGIGYDVLYDNIGTLERPPQIGSTANCPGSPTCSSATAFLAGGGIPPQASSGITVLDQADARASTSAYLPPNVQYPYAESWELGIQHTFASNYTAEVRYVGSRGVHLDVQTRLGLQNVATPATNIPTYLTAPSQATLNALPNAWGSTTSNTAVGPPFYGSGQNCVAGGAPAICGDVSGTQAYNYNVLGDFFQPAFLNDGFYSEITSYQPWGQSSYEGLQTQLNRRFASGLQLQAAWTWSHTIDDATADFFSTVINPRRPQTFGDLASEMANSPLDHAHRITIEAVYEVPWYKHSSSWFARNLLGNYEFAPVYTWESGQWGTVQSGIDSNLNSDSAGDRAILNPSGQPNLSSGVVGLMATAGPNAGDIVAWQATNPNARYITAGYGALPTSSRDTLSTPPINDLDITLAKHFAMGERFRIDLQAQFLNSLNHPQFTTGLINQVNEVGDTSGGVKNYFVAGSSTFDNARQTFSSNPRTTQLVLKFIF